MRDYGLIASAAPCHCPDCGKVCYLSRKDARRAATQVTGRRHGSKLRVYRCGRYWHLTSQPTATLTAYRDYGKGTAA